MIDTKALRSRVLDLAIQGKLTEQLESDGTAEELWQQIQAEKQRLIKEGKIKHEKPLPEITPDEIPFEIPENWKWVRLGNIVTVLGGKRIPAGRSLTTDDTGHKYIRVSDMKNLSVDTSNLLYVPEDIYPSISRYIINKEDVYITVAGTIGRVGTIPDEIDGANLTENADRLVFSDLDKYWLVYCLYSNAVQKQIEFLTTQVAQPKLAIKRIQEFCIPLPPLAEQKRIVARVEEIFRLLDIIDAAQEQYAADAESLKAKLITLGIQGRLTEQLESDGTAEELYQQIQAEKQRLIKEGKIKKEKPLPEIKPEEVPFEIPGNWKWVYLGEIFQHNTGKALNSANADGKLLEYITTSNVYWDRFELKSLKQMRFNEDEIEKCTIKKGDLLICEGGDIGRSAIWCFDYDMRIQNHLHRLRGYKPDICVKYYYYLMWLYKATGKIDGRGIGLQGFSSKRVHSLIVPLPPLAEQKRIAETLERVLGLL